MDIQTIKYILGFIALFIGALIAVFWLYCSFIGRKAGKGESSLPLPTDTSGGQSR